MVQVVLNVIMISVGMGLINGKKAAVKGVIALMVITLSIAAFFLVAFKEKDAGLSVLIMSCLLYVPPFLAAGFKWEEFD